MYTLTSYKPHFYDAVCRLGELSFDDDIHDVFRNALRDTDPQSIVVLNGRTVIGFALLSAGRCKRTLPTGIEISFLCIHPEYQRQGIGSALLQKVKDLNYEHVWLEVSDHNPEAAALYRRHGFVVWSGCGWGEWRGFVMGFSAQRHAWLPRLRSYGHSPSGETGAPYPVLPQTDNTHSHHSR